MPYRTLGLLFYFLVVTFIHAEAQSLEKQVDAYLKPLVESTDFYGSVLIAKNGKILLAKGYGYADIEHLVPNKPSSVFHLASLNKPLTAIGIMVLHQRGDIDINDPLNVYISDYPLGESITIKDLLGQTSGIPSYNDFSDYTVYANRQNSLRSVVNWFKDVPLLFTPGTKYDYSNSNYVLLAYLIEVITGLHYEDFMYSEVFQPLEMNHTEIFKYDEIVKNRATGYSPANNSYGVKTIGYYNNSIKVGSGAVHSTVLDIFKLERAIYTDMILTAETRKLMLTEIGNNEYGLGWGIWPRFGRKKYDHDGSSPGAVAYFSTYPEDKVTIIFLGNINSGVFHKMKKDLAAIYFNEPYEYPVTRKYELRSPAELVAFEGRYKFENGSFFDLKVVEGDLRFFWRGRGDVGYLLSPLENSSFYMRARGDQIDFITNGDGKMEVYYLEKSGKSKLEKINIGR